MTGDGTVTSVLGNGVPYFLSLPCYDTPYAVVRALAILILWKW